MSKAAEMRVLYVTSDLFFSSRVSSLARECGIAVDFVAAVNAEERISAGVRLVILDLAQRSLDTASLVRAIREKADSATIVAYGPHVDEDALSAAREAGCDEVLPRSQFDQQILQILQRLSSDDSDA